MKTYSYLAAVLGLTACGGEEGLPMLREPNVAPRAAGFVLSPDSVDFGEVRLGSARRTRSVRIVNDGQVTLRGLRLEPRSGFLPSVFGAQIVRGGQVPPGGARELSTSFRVLEEGLMTSSFDVVATLDDESERALRATVRLRGEGVRRPPLLAFSSSRLDFGNVVIGTSVRRQLEITNQSTENQTLVFDVDGRATDCFAGFCVMSSPSGTETTPLVLGPDETRSVELRYFPVNARDRTLRQNLNIALLRASDRRTEPFTSIELAGQTVQNSLRCNPTDIDFGPVRVGSCADSQIHCRNASNVDVTIYQYQLRGLLPDVFKIPPFGTTVVPSASPDQPEPNVSLPIRFCPIETDDSYGVIDIDTDERAAHPSTQIEVRGQGV